MQTHTTSGRAYMRKTASWTGPTLLAFSGLLRASGFAQEPSLYCRIDGTVQDESLGQHMALLSDTNGDGIRELGVTGTYFRSVDGVTGEPLFQVDDLGTSDLANVGDLNGDGIDDMLIGMPFYAGGSAWTMSGATGAFLYGTFSPSGGNYGISVDGVGDVDGDGVPDFAVGAPADNSAGLLNAGSVTVCSGVDGHTLWKFLGSDEVSGGFANGLGSVVRGVGDQDRDGVPDVIAGPAISPSKCYVLSGPAGDVIRILQPVAGLGMQVADIANLGDLSLDGVSEIALGVVDSPENGLLAGAVDIYLGGSDLIHSRLLGEIPGERFGFHVAGKLDLDGDGLPEIVAGADPCLAAVSYCVNFGRVRVYSGATSSKIFEVVGKLKAEAFGSSIALLGDVNGDGIGEFAVGAYGDNNGVDDAGKVLIYSATTSAALIADKAFVKPLVGGGTVQMRLQPGLAHAGELFVLLSSSSGNAPGLVLGDLYLPLVPDSFTTLALTPGAVPLTPIAGVIAPSGSNLAQLVIPPGLANGLAGITLTQAYLLFDPLTLALTKASNSVPVSLLKN